MVTEDLMRKYKYGYVHSCKLLEEPFVKDLLKENQELQNRLEKCVPASEEVETIRRMNKRIEKLKNELDGYKNVILANNNIPNLEDFLNKPINPDLSNWSICDIQYIKGYLYSLSLREQELKNQLEEYRKTNEHLLDKKQFLKQENQLLKKRLENCYCNRTDCSGRIKDSKVYDSLEQKIEAQQKQFIKYLEDESKETYRDGGLRQNIYKEILQKYKEIVGVSDENKRN